MNTTPSSMNTLKHCKVCLCTIVVFSISMSACLKGGDFLLCNDLNIHRLLSELKTIHNLLLFFCARIPRQSYVGHNNLKVELQVFPNYEVPLTFYIY